MTRASRTERAERVAVIVQLMVSSEWRRGETTTELAEEWGYTRGYVEQLACEASRYLDATTKDRPQLVAALQTRLRRIGEMDGPDRVQAIRTLLENMGELRQKHDVHVDLGGMSEHEVMANACSEMLECSEGRTALLGALTQTEAGRSLTLEAHARLADTTETDPTGDGGST